MFHWSTCYFVGRCHRVRVTEIGLAITRMRRLTKSTNISAECYLLNDMTKANQTLAADSLNEAIDHFMQLHKIDKYNRTEIEEKDIINKDNTRNMPHTGQMNKHRYTENIDTIAQSENITIDICKCKNQSKD